LNEIRAWTTKDSASLYNVPGWSAGYFRINDAGHIEVTPEGQSGPSVDLYDLVQGPPAPRARHAAADAVLRHPPQPGADAVRLLRERHARVRLPRALPGVYPIKVNQQHQVVEELVRFGSPYGLGLEAGSKPELLAGPGADRQPRRVLVLNGYKDVEYIETALLSQKLGRYPIVVIDRYRELDLLLPVARRLGIRPHIGVRTKLTTKGAGKWMESTGDRSKFGSPRPRS
jgi:arginine decarboxylase